MPTRYQQQLDYIFNRPVTDPAWYWEDSDEEEEHPFNGEDPLAALIQYAHSTRSGVIQ